MWRTTWTERWHALPQAIQLVSQHVNFASHVLVALLEIDYKIDGFAQNLPFARFHAAVGRQLISQFIKQIFHFLPTLSLGKLV